MATSDERRQHERAVALFQKLCDRPAHEQEAALDRESFDDATRDEVRALLGLDRTDTPLDASRINLNIPTSSSPLDPVDAIPDAIGPYRIVRLLGRGGMGSVFEAEQSNPKRRVALKIVNGVVAVKEVLRRFEHESYILGLLQHPGIAQIIEAGTFEIGRGARPYFAMEYVVGDTLDAYADQQQLDTSERLALFATICDAVHHAHQRGVVHRDLKPPNILVDGNGQAKVLDFGVARVTEAHRHETMLTEVGQIVGTLGYMSPEQASGDVDLDTSSDVYSLGVVLYELLCGQMPHDVRNQSLHNAMKIVVESNPPPLGSIDKSLRGDVETIVHKALEKEKSRRYESAAALAADIRRHLQDEPIAARPPTATYQLRKFAQRNRAFVGGIALTMLTLIVSTIIAIQLTIAKERERADADAVANFLSDLFKDVKPTDRAPSEITALELLDAGYAKLEDYTDGEPLRRAMLMESLGATYRELTSHERAEELLSGAVEIRARYQGPDHLDTLDAMNSLGIVYRKTGRSEQAVALYEKVLAGRRAALGRRDESVAQAMNNLSVALRSLKRNEEALTLVGEASQIMLDLRGPEDVDAITQRANYGLNLVTAGHEEGIDVLVELYKVAREALGPRHKVTLHVGYALGTSYVILERPVEAADLLESVLKGQLDVFGDVSSEAASTWYSLGEVQRRLGENERALESLRQAHECGVKILGAGHSWVISSRFKQALALLDLGRLVEARRIAEECAARAEESLGPAHRTTTKARDLILELDDRDTEPPASDD